MKLFRLNKTNLNEVEQIPFKLERDIQTLWRLIQNLYLI